MNKLFILIFAIYLTSSCSSIISLHRKQFIYTSKNRELSIYFYPDNTCLIKNIFLCKNIDEDFREQTINATYKRSGKLILLKNAACVGNGCIFPEYIEIPIQKDSDCFFLNAEARQEKVIFDGRKFQTEYHKYGLVPNIDIDTMYISDKKIILIKKSIDGNFGFIFKQNKKIVK